MSAPTARKARLRLSPPPAPTRYIAGGTTLYDLMKLDVERPEHLIDVIAIRGLARIDTGSDRLRFEALAPMSAVATDRVVLRDYPVLAASLAKAASQQLQSMATVGGNLLQCTRRLYFRDSVGGVSAGTTYKLKAAVADLFAGRTPGGNLHRQLVPRKALLPPMSLWRSIRSIRARFPGLIGQTRHSLGKRRFALLGFGQGTCVNDSPSLATAS